MKVRKTMSQEYRMPEGGQESYGKRLWHLWSPLILKMAIGFGVSVLAAGAFTIIFMANNPDLVNQATMDQSKISDLYQQLMGEILQVTTIVEGVAALVTIPVLLVMFHKDRLRERMAGIVPNKKAPLWKYFALILMVLGISLGFNNLVLIGNLSSYDAAYEQTISLLYAAPFAAQIICLGVLVPMCEELVFRGLMFKRLRERAPFWQAALYASAVFAFLHMNMIQMIYGFLLGMVFCYIYEKYGSVKAPVAAHIAVNLLSVFATQFHLFDWLLQEPMRAGVITVVCAAVDKCLDSHVTDWSKIKNTIRDELGGFVWKQTKRNPMILPIIMEVDA